MALPSGATFAGYIVARRLGSGATGEVYLAQDPRSAPDASSFFMRFADGQWQSQPEHVELPCVGPNGSAATQTTTLVLSLRPQPHGDFVGEQTLTVQTNECGQRSAVIRIPAVASRSGDVPPAVTVPDPATGPENPSAPITASTAAPTVAPSSPHP